MSNKRLNVVAIGNAIVDVISQENERFLIDQSIEKGGMTLIDADRAKSLYGSMGPGIEMSGGSVANSAAGIASLGGHVAYIGKVANDQLGAVFAHDISAQGVSFDTQPLIDADPTARCLIVVTPDAQRSMSTFLGACVHLGPEDIEEPLIASAEVVYHEGYLWDRPRAKAAFEKAMDLTHKHEGRVALTLSDAFCVDRWRDEFKHLIANKVDILFANEAEIKSLYQTDDFDTALQTLGKQVEIAALTRSEKGSIILRGNEVHVIDAEPVASIKDTTGAGDLYAAGFLFGLTHGYDLHDCGRIASIAAAEVISHFGARPEQKLQNLVAQKLG